MNPTTEEVISYISSYDNPFTSDLLGINIQPLERFITSDTDLYLLTLLAKANAQGLDLVFVDMDKFLNANYGNIEIQYLTNEPPPWQGACYTNIDLSFIFHDGCSFVYEGTAEGRGLDFTLNTHTLLMQVAENFSDNTLAWMDCDIRTVNDFVIYLNKELRPLKEPTPSKRSLLLNFAKNAFETVIIAIVYFFIGIWFVFKQLRKVYAYFRVEKPN